MYVDSKIALKFCVSKIFKSLAFPNVPLFLKAHATVGRQSEYLGVKIYPIKRKYT